MFGGCCGILQASQISGRLSFAYIELYPTGVRLSVTSELANVGYSFLFEAGMDTYKCIICGWTYGQPSEFTLEEHGLVCKRPRCQLQYARRLMDVVAESRIFRGRGRRFNPQVDLSREVPGDIKRAVELRDGGICQYCGEDAECLDHVLPYSKGGDHTVTNLVQSCDRCNELLSDQILGSVYDKRQWVLDQLGIFEV